MASNFFLENVLNINGNREDPIFIGLSLCEVDHLAVDADWVLTMIERNDQIVSFAAAKFVHVFALPRKFQLSN